MKDSEVLIPDKRIVKVGNREYRVGKLSLEQSILLGRFVMRTIIGNQEKLAEFAKKTEKTETNVQDLMAMIDLLDPQDLFELFGILLKENDRPFLIEYLDLECASEIIAVTCQKNDFDKIKKNIQAIGKILKLGNKQKED